jgi:threonylcarbamoyladenosine tRNA methylthiotransferase MtaB
VSVEVITLGCRLNAAESAAMRALAAGEDDLVIVNSCAVTNEAVRQTRQAIRRAKRARPDARVVVTGCAAQVEPETFAAMPEVSRVLGNRDKFDKLAFRRSDNADRTVVSDIMSAREPARQPVPGFAERARAFVPVQTGCDHRCTFCIIPFGRGNSRSVPAKGIGRSC